MKCENIISNDSHNIFHDLPLKVILIELVIRIDSIYLLKSLIDFLNSKFWTNRSTMRYIIHAKDETGKNYEPYLSCGLANYGKFIFWEVPLYAPPIETITLDASIYIDHVSKLDTVKSYWTAGKPWFETEDSEEAATVKGRYDRLVADFGPEPQGMARASNPACDSPYLRIKATNPPYVNFCG